MSTRLLGRCSFQQCLQDAGILCQPLHTAFLGPSPQAGELQGFQTSHSLQRQLDSLLHLLPAYSGHRGLYVWVGVDLD